MIIKIPYNFDLKLPLMIKEIAKRHTDLDYVFYVPCLLRDSKNSRQGVVKNRYFDCDEPEIFEHHIQNIQKNGFAIEILFQQIDKVISQERFEYYLNLGIRRFTCSNDENAHFLKQIDKDIFISASIGKFINLEYFDNKDYDEICLFYYYNRNLNKILKTNKYSYSIVVNQKCRCDCKMGLSHFNLINMACNRQDGSAIISYKDYMLYFKDTVNTIKLVDRLSSSEEIFSSVSIYSGDNPECDYPHHEISFYNLNTDFPKQFITDSNISKYYSANILEN